MYTRMTKWRVGTHKGHGEERLSWESEYMEDMYRTRKHMEE